jgi:hypothetical protein
MHNPAPPKNKQKKKVIRQANPMPMIEGLTREEMQMIAMAQAEIDAAKTQSDDFTSIMMSAGDFTLQKNDKEIIEGGVELLHEIRIAAETIDDLQNELATEIYETCLLAHKRIIKLNTAVNMKL